MLLAFNVRMAGTAKCNEIAQCKRQFRVFSAGFDVVGMQIVIFSAHHTYREQSQDNFFQHSELRSLEVIGTDGRYATLPIITVLSAGVPNHPLMITIIVAEVFCT